MGFESGHRVTLTRDFYMSAYEVTQGQYEAVTGANPSHFTGNDNRPVEMVTWFDAIHFANALSKREGFASCYDDTGAVIGGAGGDPYGCEGYRLPTEAEWEYAARAGSTTKYSFGNDASQLGDYAWFYENLGRTTHAVGQKKLNAWGLYDMHGNVWEWVQDWYSSVSGRSSVDPSGPASGSYRVIRGGSWISSAVHARSAIRSYSVPVVRNFDRGFRLVRTAR